MPLSEDQKAMLRLLAQREQGYDDLAALMGLSVDEVRAKVKDALGQLEEEGKEAPPLPVEPAAEEAAPIESPAPPATPSEPEPVAPKPPPVAPDKPEPTVTTAKSAPTPRSKPSLPQGNGARAALAAGIAVVVALVIVLVLSGGDNSGDTKTTASDETTAASETTGNAANSKLTQAILSPVDGSDAKGVATFGRVKNSLALQLEAEGLTPTKNGQSYTIWLYESPQKMLPLASTAVPANGKIGAQVEVPTEVLAYLANESFNQLDISLTDDAALKTALAKATKEKKAPTYTGTDVLRGTITGPIIGAAKKK
jgi:hypothetical protein